MIISSHSSKKEENKEPAFNNAPDKPTITRSMVCCISALQRHRAAGTIHTDEQKTAKTTNGSKIIYIYRHLFFPPAFPFHLLLLPFVMQDNGMLVPFLSVPLAYSGQPIFIWDCDCTVLHCLLGVL